jgi:DNA-binding transcriptional MerR regulator
LRPCFVDGANHFDEAELEALAAKRAAMRAAPSRPSVKTAGAMRLLGVSRAQLRRLEESGAIRATRAGESGHRWYDVAELKELAADRAKTKQSRSAAEPPAVHSALLDVFPASHPTIPQQGKLAISAELLEELRTVLGSKIANANALVARVQALAADYGALEEELRRTEDELAERAIELAELRASTSR